MQATRSAVGLGTVLALSTAGAQAPVPGVTTDTVTIGMEAPSGAFSLDEENLGMRVLVEQTNDAGGVHGHRIEIRDRARRGGTDAEDAVRNARQLVEDERVFLLFNFGGPASIRLAEYAAAQRVPYLFPHTALVTTDDARYVFTSFPRYADETRIMFRYLAERRGLRRLAVVHDANPYGTFFRDRLRELSGDFGYEVVGAVELARNPGDVRTELNALRERRPDAVVLALFPDQARALMQAKADLAWPVTMVTSGPLTDEQYLQTGGWFAEGTIGFCHFEDPRDAAAPGIADYRAAMTRYRPGHPLNRYSLYGYVFGRLVVEGLVRAGRELTREGFIDAMETIDGWDGGGALPPVSFSPRNHHAQRAAFVCELRDGRFRRTTGWIAP